MKLWKKDTWLLKKYFLQVENVLIDHMTGLCNDCCDFLVAFRQMHSLFKKNQIQYSIDYCSVLVTVVKWFLTGGEAELI